MIVWPLKVYGKEAKFSETGEDTWLVDEGQSRHHMLETGDLQRQGCLTQVLPRAACWSWIQAHVAGRRSGQREKMASPDPELTPGVGGALEDGLPHPALLI